MITLLIVGYVLLGAGFALLNLMVSVDDDPDLAWWGHLLAFIACLTLWPMFLTFILGARLLAPRGIRRS